MHQKFPQSSTVLRVFALILACFFSAVAAMAQGKVTNIEPVTQAETVATSENPSVAEIAVTATDPSARKADAKSPKPAAETSTITSTAVTKSNDTAGTRSATNDYKKSLSDLQTLYESDVRKLEQRNTQVKGLFRDGIISRVEMDKS